MAARLLLVLGFLLGCRPGYRGPPADPSCTRNGCLRAYRLVGRYPRVLLQASVQKGLRLQNGYSVFDMRFYTDGLESTATVDIPFDPGLAPPPGGWNIVANNHGTVGIADPCALHGTPAGAGLAGLFGARRAIGVAVDYPGLGTHGVHPYLVARVEGESALDGLRAARQLATLEGVPTTGRYAMVGLSQGGHATLSAAALHATYAPDLDVRAFATVAPATVWESHWSQGVAARGPHIPIHAMLLYAWAHYYPWPATAKLWTDATAATIDKTMTTLCVFPRKGPSLVEKISEDPTQVFAPALLAAYQTRKWGAYAFVHDAFDANRVRPYKQTAPLRIYQGDADDVVPEWSTRQVVDALRSGGMRLEYEVVPGGTHSNVAFGFVAFKELRTDESLAWVRARLDEAAK